MRAIVSLLVLIVSFQNQVLAASRVDLVLNEVQERTVPWPITTGVPFPRGQLAAAEHCRLVDDTGVEHLLQAKPSANWDGPHGSVRWLTIDFIAVPGRKFALEFGADVQRKVRATSLQVDRDKVIQVRTGALSAEFPQQGSSPANFRLGGDRVADSASVSYVEDGKQAVGTPRHIEIEGSGPVRACIRVDGEYLLGNARRVDYRTRYHFFAGLGLMKVVHEIRFVESTKDRQFQAFDFTLGLRLDPKTWQAAVDSSGEPGNQTMVLKPSMETTHFASYQSSYRHYGNPECQAGIADFTGQEKELKSHEQAGEWLQVKDERVVITGSMRWFWQQFPVEWQGGRDALRSRLWSPRGGNLDFSAAGIRRFFGEAGDKYLLDWKGTRPPQSPIERFFYFAGRAALNRGDADGLGINKHHEFYVHFAPAKQAATGAEYGRLVAEPPLALASGAWNAASEVMGPIAARPNDSPYEAIVDRLFDLSRGVQDTFGDYGWWLFGAGPHYSYQWDAKTGKHYADPRRFEYHTYQRETQHWWNYLRSGERKFLDWALPAENHWVDIAVSHQPAKFFTEYLGGAVSPATLHWARGDWAIDSTIHYLRHHDTGEAWLRGQSQFWGTYHRTLETTTLAYYLTGDERFNDVIEYWRSYYGDLAGKTSDSQDFQPWHREQAWYRPTPKGEAPKSWAALIRDYAPFNSGSRHQQTLFFNLATLYEHTWDPKIGQTVREYADAFLDPDHPLGVWRSQDNRAPIRAEAPIMAHYWVPALWRYARATRDPRMQKVFDRYFKACLGADPFQGDVGVYSNVQIGYAYAFSKDPRHLRAAVAELEELKPHAEPLAKPEDLGPRLYNPYAPVRCFTGVPRLIWALQEAKRTGVGIPPPAVTHLQRAPLAWKQSPNTELTATLWGFDRTLDLRGPDGQAVRDVKIETTRYLSATQPFDRDLPEFAVFEHRLTLPLTAPAGWYFLVPRLELAIIELTGGEGAWCHAAQPVALHPGKRWHWKIPANVAPLQIDTGLPRNLRIAFNNDRPVAAKMTPTGWLVSFTPEDAGTSLRFENTGNTVLWFRLSSLNETTSWVATDVERLQSLPPAPSIKIAEELPTERFTAGRFGKGIVITPGTTLKLPDHEKVDGVVHRFFDTKQGTLEFWVKTFWDSRLRPMPRVSFLNNGLIDATVPWKLPYREWAHVALVWRPLKKDPQQTVLHVYVNGVDHANYRSTYWAGYSNRPLSLPANGKWLEGFLSRAAPGTAFALDELRLSSASRYVDSDVEFGGQQTVNPYRFTPAGEPFKSDAATELLLHFDGDLRSDGEGRRRAEGTITGGQP